MVFLPVETPPILRDSDLNKNSIFNFFERGNLQIFAPCTLDNCNFPLQNEMQYAQLITSINNYSIKRVSVNQVFIDDVVFATLLEILFLFVWFGA